MSIFESLLRRERLITQLGLACIALLAWLYVITGAGTGMDIGSMSRLAISPGAFAEAPSMPMQSMPMQSMPTPWTPRYWIIVLLMWWVMMIAMMVPSAAPTILLYGRVSRHAKQQDRLSPDPAPTAIFAAGYILVWLAFSALATVAQFALERAALLSSMTMWSLSPWLSASVLLGAGLYQLTPLKQVCIRHCRAPAQFLARHYRAGRAGALVMGSRHGAYCVGCCWALMALLFVGGIMNVTWIAGLAIVVLAEKLLPGGERLARILGVACIAAAGWIALRALGFA